METTPTPCEDKTIHGSPLYNLLSSLLYLCTADRLQLLTTHTHTQGQSVVLTSAHSPPVKNMLELYHTLVGQWQPESLVFRVGVCLLTSAHSSRLVAAQYGVLQVVDMAQNQGTPRSSYSSSPTSSRANGANTSSIRSSVYFRGGISGCGQWCASKNAFT